MKKRILTVLLAVCLVFALGTVTALADSKLPAADNGKITLTSNLSLTRDELATELSSYFTANADKALTIDLNKNTLTITSSTSTGVEINGNLTIQNGSIVANEQTNEATSVLKPTSNATLVLNNIVMATNGTAIYAAGNATAVRVINSNITAGAYVIGTNASVSGGDLVYSNNVKIYVSGSTLKSVSPILVNVPGTLDVNNSTIIGVNHGIIVRGGSAEINNTGITLSGATDAAEYDKYATSDWGSGNGVPMAGIVVGNRSNAYNYPAGCTISGSTTVSVSPAGTNAVYAYQMQDTTNRKVTLDIEGGTFNADVVVAGDSGVAADVQISGGKFTNTSALAPYLENGYTFDSNGNVEISDDAVATVNGTPYTDLQDAIDAAQRGTTKTVTLLKDVSVSAAGFVNNQGAITITEGIILDGDTHTISITSIDAGATPSAINIQNSANVTLKDLTIDSNGAKHGLNINNNANVTLENVKILDSAQYAIVCNSSKLTVNGLYTQGNAWGINVDSKTSAKSDVTINDVTITETDSIVLENSNDVGSNLVINGGTFNNIKKQGDNTNDIDVDVNGGTFGMSIITVADEHPDYQVRLGSRYSYYDDADDALNAAGTTGVVTYVGPNTTVTHDVTLYYDKDHVVTLEVADEGVIYLPSGYFDGKHIDGWDERYGGNYKPGAKVTVERDMYFTVILRNGQYNIVIDDDIKHGDVSTDVSSADKGATVYIYVDPDIGYVLDDLDVYYGYRNQYSVNVKFVRTGVYSFIMPGYDVYITATFRYESLPFTDVNRSQWFYDEVYYVYTNGMMEGDSATTFNPDGRMTRAMFWAVLGRIDGATITGNDWAEEARAWAMREGVSDGTNPNDYVTREQMVTMLWRYAGEKNGSASLIRYTDADKISSYAVEAMRWAIGNGIIEGMTSTTLEPQGTATRAQCAAIFMRFDQM